MNVGQALTRLRSEIRENRGGSWDRDQLVSFLEDAQTEVYSRIVNSGTHEFIAWKVWTYPSDTYEVTLSTMLGARAQKVLQLLQMTTASTPSSTNSGTILEPVYGETDVVPTAFFPNISGDGTIYGTERRARGYYLVGDRFQIQPVPTSDVYLFMRYTPHPPELTTDDVLLLNGDLPEWHFVIVLHAARAALAATNSSGLEGIVGRYVTAEQRMMDTLGTQRQLQRAPHPRYRDTDTDFI